MYGMLSSLAKHFSGVPDANHRRTGRQFGVKAR
jgi:hypothetical protein